MHLQNRYKLKDIKNKATVSNGGRWGRDKYRVQD